ncbi:hypothetical protein ACKI2N_001905 [Cupriavidus sp. 30B13]|uniref:hypothetical protein n=1 Tax=Cupriavidus sp. 30B13 TaxID=3384241 RepID=UPI003B8FE6AD
MTAFVLNDDEWEAMRKVGFLARDLYGVLRRRMNFKTGVVGDLADCAISWFALREDLEVQGRPGVKRDLPSEGRVRRAMAQLVKVGLVESIGSRLLLRFRLLRAKVDSLVPNKPVGGVIGDGAGRKTKPRKVSRGYSQGNLLSKVGTHQATDKTLKPTPPTPSGLRPDGDGTAIDPPTPAAREDHNPNGDETPGGAEAQRLSEERREPAVRGGGWPAAGCSDEEPKAGLTWEAHLDWPRGIEQRQRAYMVRSRGSLTPMMFQLVLDEWHGATLAGVVAKPWPYFNSLLKAAKEQGPAWETRYAEGVQIAREEERTRLANLAAQEAAYQASLGQPGPMPAGTLGQFARSDAAAAIERRAGRRQ